MYIHICGMFSFERFFYLCIAVTISEFLDLSGIWYYENNTSVSETESAFILR